MSAVVGELTPERWQQIKDLFAAAQERHPTQQTAFLLEACGADDLLRAEVESLLIAADSEPSLGNIGDVSADTSVQVNTRSDFLIGQRVGAYKIEKQIGSGGMGEVFQAVRADDQYRKQVAIKLVRAGQYSGFVINRFRNERQILATLDHPNIGRLLDGGTTEHGVPYLVMELIEGRAIDVYCDEKRLPTVERLKLFLQVAAAVQYAHQRLIIHRDIKPSNILVTADGVPKLLDFGIAKILVPDSGSITSAKTLSIFRLMTPSYASPEQIRGEPITTASDIYSLGVLLYELLTGCWPYRTVGTAPHEIARAICESDPERPSAVLRESRPTAVTPEGVTEVTPATVSAVREGSPERVSKRLRGDLDNIVLMTLRKEPQQRYASVEQLSEDLRRHLDNLPVTASKDTVQYRIAKFIRRHKAAAAIAALVSIALLSALTLALREAQIARREQIRAERRFNDMRKLANSLIFTIHDSIQNLQGATSARKLIVQQGLEYLDNLYKESTDDPALQKELAAGYEKLGDAQAAYSLGNLGDLRGGISNYRKTVELREDLSRRFPHDLAIQIDLIKSYRVLARTLLRIGNQGEANECLEQVFQFARGADKEHPNNPDILYSLGDIEWQRGNSLWRQAKIEDALQAYTESAENFKRVTQIDPSNQRAYRSLAIAHKYMGGELQQLNKFDDALFHYRLASDIDFQALKKEPENAMRLRDSTVDLRNVGDVLVKQGKFQEARKNYASAMAVDERLVEKDRADRDTQLYLALDYEGIGTALLGMGDGSVAVASLQHAVRLHEERVNVDPEDTDAKDLLADSYVLLGDAYATLAKMVQPNPSGSLRNSCSAYYSALKNWNSLEKDGKLNKIFEIHRSTLVAKMKTCEPQEK